MSDKPKFTAFLDCMLNKCRAELQATSGINPFLGINQFSKEGEYTITTMEGDFNNPDVKDEASAKITEILSDVGDDLNEFAFCTEAWCQRPGIPQQVQDLLTRSIIAPGDLPPMYQMEIIMIRYAAKPEFGERTDWLLRQEFTRNDSNSDIVEKFLPHSWLKLDPKHIHGRFMDL